MAYTLDGSDYSKTWHIACEQSATVQHPLLAVCLKGADTLNALVPLDTIEIMLLPPPAVAKYSFKLKATDGRNWNQVIEMDAVTNPKMNWKHSSFWRRTEFVLVDAFRTSITELIQSIQPVEITVTFS